MKRQRGRPPGIHDECWPDRFVILLSAILSIQEERHTVSLRELEQACGVSRQSIVNWLEVAERLGYVDRHEGRPRGLQLLPEGRELVRRYDGLNNVDEWRQMREELRQQYDLRRMHESLPRVLRSR